MIRFKATLDALIAKGIPDDAPDIALHEDGRLFYVCRDAQYMYDGTRIKGVGYVAPLANVLTPYEPPDDYPVDGEVILMVQPQRVRFGFFMRQIGYDKYGAPYVFGANGKVTQQLYRLWRQAYGDKPFPEPRNLEADHIQWYGAKAPQLWMLLEKHFVVPEDATAISVTRDAYSFYDGYIDVQYYAGGAKVIECPADYDFDADMFECYDERGLIAMLAMYHVPHLPSPGQTLTVEGLPQVKVHAPETRFPDYEVTIEP